MVVPFYIVEKIGGGKLRRIGSRKILDIQKDFIKLLDKAKMPYDYVSCAGSEDLTWPIGQRQTDYCWLEPGGNEGWYIYIATRFDTAELGKHCIWEHHEPIRIKLLCNTDDAWRVVRFVQEHLDCW